MLRSEAWLRDRCQGRLLVPPLDVSLASSSRSSRRGTGGTSAWLKSLYLSCPRFWYENNIPPSAFTKGACQVAPCSPLTHYLADQLQELRKVSLASILCENLDGVYMVQPDVFIGLDPFLNAPVTCDVFQRIDEKNIEPWKTDSPALQVNMTRCSLFVRLGALLDDLEVQRQLIEPNVTRLHLTSNDGSMIKSKQVASVHRFIL